MFTTWKEKNSKSIQLKGVVWNTTQQLKQIISL